MAQEWRLQEHQQTAPHSHSHREAGLEKISGKTQGDLLGRGAH